MHGDFLPFLDPADVRPFVEDEGDVVNLRFDYATIQSSMRKSDPCRLELEYTRAMLLFLLFVPQPSSMLMIGLGGGSVPKYCHRYLPEARITVVEINPHVIALRDAFHVPRDSRRFKVVQGDGARHVERAAEAFDAILVDGFHFNGPSEQLGTQAFLDRCRALLRPDGVLVMNLDTEDSGDAALQERIGQAFDGGVMSMLVDGGTNRVVLAAAPELAEAVRREAPARLAALAPVHRETLTRRSSEREQWPLIDAR